jgi:hypothetical protein
MTPEERIASARKAAAKSAELRSKKAKNAATRSAMGSDRTSMRPNWFGRATPLCAGLGTLLLTFYGCDFREESRRSANASSDKTSTARIMVSNKATPVVFDFKPLLRADGQKAIKELAGRPQSRELCCSTDNEPKFGLSITSGRS